MESVYSTFSPDGLGDEYHKPDSASLSKMVLYTPINYTSTSLFYIFW